MESGLIRAFYWISQERILCSNTDNNEWIWYHSGNGPFASRPVPLLLSYFSSLLNENNPVKIDYHLREYSDKLILDIHSNVSRITNPVLAIPEHTQVSNEMILDMNSLRCSVHGSDLPQQ